MTNNKNQHYVPKCYLKSFTKNENGKQINLFNITSGKFVTNAPIKGQCAKDYFYGDSDSPVDRLLRVFEGKYPQVLENIKRNPGRVETDNLKFLINFTLLQYLRTHQAQKRSQETFEKMKAAAGAGFGSLDDIKRDLKEVTSRSIRMFFSARRYIRDLKAAIIVNEAEQEFIASDDPAIIFNRFHAQKLNNKSSGLSSAGIAYYLPLTPFLSFLAYDGQVYTAPGKNGSAIHVKNVLDVQLLNKLQFINAEQNVYFLSLVEKEKLIRGCESARELRPEAWSKISTFVSAGGNDQREYYRAATDLEKIKSKRRLILSYNFYPKLDQWPSFLNFRYKRMYYDTKNAMGLIRDPEWARPEDRAARDLINIFEGPF